MATKKKAGKKKAAKKKAGKSNAKTRGGKGQKQSKMGTPITVSGDG